MALLTREELEMLSPEKRQAVIDAEAKLDQFDMLKKGNDTVEDLLKQAYSDPKAFRALNDLNEATGKKLNLPQPAFMNFMKPLQDELEGLKKDRKEEDKRRKKEAVVAKLTEFELPNNEETYKAIDAFMAEKGIVNIEYGIEQYAKSREPDIQNVQYEKPFDFSENVPDEKAAMAGALNDIRALKTSRSRR